MNVRKRLELRIGEVARLAGTTPRTIRYCEEISLLPTAGGREPGAHRTYAERDVERLTEVLRLKDLLGLSLEELKELVEAEGARAERRREWDAGVENPVRRWQILEESLRHVGRQLELVRRRRDEIAAWRTSWSLGAGGCGPCCASSMARPRRSAPRSAC